MISDKSRADWFGASDVNRIIGSYDTKTFEKWWLEKLGYRRNEFINEAMAAGTHYEHRILRYLNILEMDKQIKLPELRLRVNLDGNTNDTIYEVKTYKLEKGFKVPISYKRQVWVQLYASGMKNAFIAAYGLTDADYRNFFNKIDGDRLQLIPIERNDEWINNMFLPRLKYLCWCLNKGMYPTNENKNNTKRSDK